MLMANWQTSEKCLEVSGVFWDGTEFCSVLTLDQETVSNSTQVSPLMLSSPQNPVANPSSSYWRLLQPLSGFKIISSPGGHCAPDQLQRSETLRNSESAAVCPQKPQKPPVLATVQLFYKGLGVRKEQPGGEEEAWGKGPRRTAAPCHLRGGHQRGRSL